MNRDSSQVVNSTLSARVPFLEPTAASLVKTSVLNSWKEIAAYLGRGVRTVQRWEHDAALPVHRPKGKDRSAVLALTNELDEWLRRTAVRSNGNGHADPDSVVPVLLELARELQAVGERLALHIDRRQRPEAEKLVIQVREIVRQLAGVCTADGASTDDAATQRRDSAA
jgi:hypothetical protein